MSDLFYKEKLYPIQDKVLRCLERMNTPFYLTGGTALSRHYLKHRYSDDLDLFQNQSQSFANDGRNIIHQLKAENFDVEIQTSDESFVRFFVRENDVSLKVELINDVGFREGSVVSSELFFRTDSWMNILSNKVTALTRNAAKDLADILFISRNFEFVWTDVIASAKNKDSWVNEINASQTIHEFDCTRLSEVMWIDQSVDVLSYESDIKKIARELLHGFKNSLAK